MSGHVCRPDNAPQGKYGPLFLDDPDLSVSPFLLTFTTSNWNQGQEVTVALQVSCCGVESWRDSQVDEEKRRRTGAAAGNGLAAISRSLFRLILGLYGS